ncbi:ubiquitin-specific protease doa4 [Ciborinia camelliae]|nr:ubiquitin-specific protease doa4 [Ciborinia camelliae]
MSPASICGPHLRATSINGIGPTNTTKRDGVNDISTLKGDSRVLPHLNDLVNAKPLVDRQSSLRKLLEAGEEAAKQAETWLDFKRPELALREYIIAYTIAVEYIPQSPHYPDLRSKPDYPRLYAGLQKRLNTQHNKFEEVKNLIKEDNERRGIRPSNSPPNNGQPVPGISKINVFEPPASYVYSNPIDGKVDDISTLRPTENRTKPTIQPKPQGLHGKSIQTANSISSSLPVSSENDLVARFARLKSLNNPTPIQDPRIRTQHITIPDEIIDQRSAVAVAQPKQNASILRPLGPREMPTSPAIFLKIEKPNLGMNTNVPVMPRMPDAIYSPARSADLVSTNSQPPLLSRGSSYLNVRRDSSTPVPKMSRNRIVVDDATDYFSSSEVNNYTFDHHAHPEPETPISKLSIPNATTVTAEQLYNYLKMGSNALSLLLVDIRSREEFDEGHIMSQSIICIEPISLQKEMSAEDLGERIVVSPEPEQKLYDQRHKFDLIVFYDQSSTSKNVEHTPVETLNHLHYFSMIIYDHAYDHRLKRRPMLLSGGLDAWIDLVGSGALQCTIPGNKSMVKIKKSGHHALGRVSIAREARRGLVTKRTAPRLRTLSAAEEEKWDMAIKHYAEHEDAPAEEILMDESYYARTAEEFMRRYPELPSVKQSMALPSMPRTLPLYNGSIISAPPTRPPPALPRQRSNGISEKTPYKSYAMTGGNSSAPPRIAPGLCGLRNVTGGSCYMNAACQVISASPGIRNMFIKFQYPCQPEIPAKPGEDGPSKVLMTRVLRSLLQHMWCGKYEEIVPTMFKEYVQSLAIYYGGPLVSEQSTENAYRPDTTFGTTRQHDVAEFLQWLFSIILEEQNLHRDIPEFGGRQYNGIEDDKLPRSQSCRQAYEKILEFQNSPLSKLIGHQYVWEVSIDPANGRKQTLRSLLDREYDTEKTEARCGECNNTSSLRAPQQGGGQAFRVSLQVDFPEVLDMAKYTWLSKDDEFSGRVLPKQKPPFLYDCYGVVLHAGTVAAGHYWTLIRRVDENNQWTNEWHEFNDSVVTAGKTFADTQSKNTVLVLYRRQGCD